jgi:type IV secretion system protein VirD4
MSQGEWHRIGEAVGSVILFLYQGAQGMAWAFYRALWWLWNVTPYGWPVWAKLAIYPAIPFGIVTARWAFRKWRWRPRVFGEARFATLKELREAGLLRPGGRFLGRFEERRFLRGWQAADLFMHGEGHCLTIAAQGSGKTTGLIIPTLLTYRAGSVVVTDPKGAITAQTRRHRESLGRVVVLNPWRRELMNDPAFGMDLGDDGFNPLQGVDTTPEGRAAAAQIAALLVPDMPGESQPYFRQDARGLLGWCLLWQAVVIKDPVHRTLPRLHGLIYDLPHLAELMKAHSEDKSNGPGRHALRLGASKFYGMYKSAPAQFTGVLGTLTTALSIYEQDSHLGEHVSAKGGFSLSDIKGGEPITLYLICPPGHLVGDDRKWLNLVLALIAQEIGKPGLARETVLLMDEFPALGYLPNLAPALEQFREAGLRAHLIAQNPGQIVTTYNQDGLSRLWGACETKQFFRITDPNHASVLSDWLGRRQVENFSVNQKGEVTRNLVEVPLIRAERLTGMPQGRQVIMRPAMNPIWASVIPYYRRTAWRGLVDPNPYRDGPPKQQFTPPSAQREPVRTAQPEPETAATAEQPQAAATAPEIQKTGQETAAERAEVEGREAEAPDQPAPKKRGRPRGSKNRKAPTQEMGL